MIVVAVVIGGCGSNSHDASAPVEGTYLYTSPQGDAVLSLNLVQHGSRLSGEAEELAPESSEEANGLTDVEGTIFDAHGHSVPAGTHNKTTDLVTESTDNAACGGTPLCFSLQSASVDGWLGNENRVSLHFSWRVAGGFSAGQETWVGTHPGSALDLIDKGTRLSFRPSDRHKVETAEREAPAKLRAIAIPLYALHQENQYLLKNARDPITGKETLFSDVNALQQSFDESDLKRVSLFEPADCPFPGVFEVEIAAVRDDVDEETEEIKKARRAIASLPSAARRFSGETVRALEKTISARESVIRTELAIAEGTIAEAQKTIRKDSSFLNQFGCGVHFAADFAFHKVLEGLAGGL